MLNLFDKIRSDDKGDVVVEFAAALPLLLMLCFGMMEIGRAFMQANTVEKGMRTAAIYAARAEDPAAQSTLNAVENLVKTGTLDGSGPVLVSGWSLSGASLNVTQSTYNLDGQAVPVIRLNASVPFDPVMPGVLSFFGMDDFAINLSHEQAFLND